jgi:REP element-mobilizing transposase RayT
MRHNVSVLLYHIVCPAKYRRVVFTPDVDEKLKETCLEISKRYEITFLEIGTDQDHVHFLVQSVPLYSPKRIVQIIKSITAREILRACPSSLFVQQRPAHWRCCTNKAIDVHHLAGLILLSIKSPISSQHPANT